MALGALPPINQAANRGVHTSDMVMNSQDDVIKNINMDLEKMPKPLGQVHTDEYYPWVVFSLENAKYAISAKQLLRVAFLYEIIPVKNAPAYCPGIAWNRDGMTYLLDLRLMYGLGDYRSFMSKGKDLLPTTITIELEGQKLGIIVDRVLAMKYLKDATIPIINLNSFYDLEYEKPNAEINWSARIDMRLLAESLHKKSPR